MDGVVEKVLREHESRIVLLSNRVKWLEKELTAVNELTRKTNERLNNLKCSGIRKRV